MAESLNAACKPVGPAAALEARGTLVLPPRPTRVVDWLYDERVARGSGCRGAWSQAEPVLEMPD